MVNPLSAYRVYASTLGSIENLPYANLDKEMHIVLAFARDYSVSGANTTGDFETYFDTNSLTGEAIRALKNKANYTSIKFFLSIGGRDSRFPFAVDSVNQSRWIQNAIKSLKQIVEKYSLDGIDVYYEHINNSAETQFTKSIFKVISDLKKTNVISKASITVPSRHTNRYFDLFKENDKLFDYVVYQTHTETVRISNFTDVVPVIQKLRFPQDRILAGHSDVHSDWVNVPPPIFLGAVPQLLETIFGISNWIVIPQIYNPEA